MITRLPSHGQLSCHRTLVSDPPKHRLATGGLRDVLPSRVAFQRKRQIYGLQEKEGAQPTPFGAVTAREWMAYDWTEMERAADVEQRHQDVAACIKQRTDRKERILLRLGEDASNIAASLRAELASSREAQEHRHEEFLSYERQQTTLFRQLQQQHASSDAAQDSRVKALQRQVEERDQEVASLTKQKQVEKTGYEIRLADAHREQNLIVGQYQRQADGSNLTINHLNLLISAMGQNEQALQCSLDRQNERILALQQQGELANTQWAKKLADLKQQKDQHVSHLEQRCADLQRDLQSAVAAAHQAEKDKRKSDVLALVVEAARRTNEELQGNVQRTATKLVRSKATIRHLRSQASTQASVYGEDMKADNQARWSLTFATSNLRTQILNLEQGIVRSNAKHAREIQEHAMYEVQAYDKWTEIKMKLMADNDVINGNLEMALTLSDGLRDSLNEALAKIKVLEHAQKEDSLHSHHCAEGFVGKIASLDNLPNATLCERDSLIAALHPESANAHMWDETPAADLDDDHQEESDDEDFLEEEFQDHSEYEKYSTFEEQGERCLRGRHSKQKRKSFTISKFRKGQ